MKMKLLALTAAVVGGAALLFGGTASAAGPGPNDHVFSFGLSPTTAGSATDITTVLTLGTNQTFAGQTPFFGEATAYFDGLAATTCLGKSTAGAISGCATPSSFGIGAHLGHVDFNIGTNQGSDPGNIDPATGQPPECGSDAGQAVINTGFETYEAVSDLNSSTWPSTPSAVSGYSKLAEPDTANGGAPHGVTYAPDWYPITLGLLGIPNVVIQGRGYGLAPSPGGGATDVTFLSIKSPNGNPIVPIVNVTILGNPIAAFDPSHQTLSTCPGFASAPVGFGSTVSNLGTPGAVTWNCATNGATLIDSGWASAFSADLVTPSPCSSGTLSNPGGIAATKVAAGATGTQGAKILLASAPDIDGDGVFAQYDGCPADAGGTNSSNGLGSACSGGGSWINQQTSGIATGPENSNASAVDNGTLTCTSTETGHGSPSPTTAETDLPYAACQDADQDGALNSVDNCPFTQNTSIISVAVGDNQTDSDRDGMGDACDPNPVVPGTGSGYATGFLSGTGASGVATSGTYKIYNDICTRVWTVGSPAAVTAGTCLANDDGYKVIDSNASDSPDFIDLSAAPAPYTNAACVADYKADSNHDGYTDGVQATPSGATTCTKSVLGGMGQDPLLQCGDGAYTPGVGRLDAAHGGDATQDLNYRRAKANVNHNAKVDLADLIIMAGQYNLPVGDSTDFKNALNLNGSTKVDLADLIIAAGLYNQTVGGC